MATETKPDNDDVPCGKRVETKHRDATGLQEGCSSGATNQSGTYNSGSYFRATKNDTRNYITLDPSRKEIRYIAIAPSAGSGEDSELVCSLGYTNLNDADRIRYEALSYCWGDISDTVPITLLHSTAKQLNRAHESERNMCTSERISQEFRITTNLAAALRKLRYEDRDRVLWVDAICINQNHHIERSQQVGSMSQIFSSAERVLVWLGEEDDTSRIVVRMSELYSLALERKVFSKVAKDQNVIENENEVENVKGEEEDEEEDEEEGQEQTNLRAKEDAKEDLNEGLIEAHNVHSDKGTDVEHERDSDDIDEGSDEDLKNDEATRFILHHLDKIQRDPKLISEDFIKAMPDHIRELVMRAINLFLTRTWFKRAWVIQEVLCAPQNYEKQYAHLFCRLKVIVKIGNSQITWFDLSRLLKLSWVRVSFELIREGFTDGIWQFHFTWNSFGKVLESDILQVLYRTWSFEASDQRDRLFALLGVAKDTKSSNSHLILPDYTKSLSQVLTDFARWDIETTCSLRMLSCKSTTRETFSIPSWVPNLPSVPNEDRIIEMDTAMRHAYLQEAQAESGTLPKVSPKVGFNPSIRFQGSSLLVVGRRVSRIQRVMEQYVSCNRAGEQCFVSPTLGDQENEDLFLWLLKAFWDPLKEPSDARFLENCLKMFGPVVTDEGGLLNMGLMHLKAYFERYGLLDRLHDTAIFSDLNQYRKGYKGKLSRNLAAHIACICLIGNFFTTEEEELGLGHKIEKGDIVVALVTAKFPYVLRPCPVPHLEGKYYFVGWSFFYGQEFMTHEKYQPTPEKPLEVFELV